ncbi:MAG: ATP-dependent RNA helicase DeaD [Candidatus Azotimanducaceae bacterium]|jgi:ATP-dependent RNA helicase DeaD
MSELETPTVSFDDLGLSSDVLAAVNEVGYETPSPIQALTIPHLMQGTDLLGHAPTGTGKTAAFALPLLSRLDMTSKKVQVMVLAPTRELAIQVAEAFQRYASKIQGFHVLPVYGGQPYLGQIKALQRGVQVVVGTPGRVMDHMRKGTLKLDHLQALVLDEADEMLNMGFLEDVEWVLEQTPQGRQIALFSATMPKEIKRVADKHLNNPQEIRIKTKTATADTIRQRYWQVSNMHKLDALTRILEVETFDAMLMFVRTKIQTVELAQKLEARGYSAAALNGDMIQKTREQMVDRLKKGSLDILVATDVAARGLDVERITHVINYDIPNDTEAYIHRIGRTGRAGRTGDAILFVSPREQRMLKAIERATKQKIDPLELPTTEMVNNKRIADFKQSISDTIAGGRLEFMQGILEQFQQEHDIPALEIAAALAKMSLGDRSLLLVEKKARKVKERSESRSSDDRFKEKGDSNRNPGSRNSKEGSSDRPDEKFKKPRRDTSQAEPRRNRDRKDSAPPEGMERFRIAVGHIHEVQPGNIVGAIANESGLDAEHIGHINIQEDHSLIDLPMGMPKDIFRDLKKAWVCGRKLDIVRLKEYSEGGTPSEPDTTSTIPKAKKSSSKDKKPRKVRKSNSDED